MNSLAPLWQPTDLMRPNEVLQHRSSLRFPGMYAWYCDCPIPEVPGGMCHEWTGKSLMYVGIAPKGPHKRDGRTSTRTVADRLSYEIGGYAQQSPVRLKLGCLLGFTPVA